MEKVKFYITDVFGKKKYAGNQLATLLEYGRFSDEEMQQIAHEINFSETTFITSKEKKDGGFSVRIFTPESEIDFAGHPTLGTAHILRNYVDKERSDHIILNLKVGQIPVEFSNDEYQMTQVQPKFGEEFSTNLIASLLNIAPNDILREFPACEVSTGLPFTIVPLVSGDTLKHITVNMEVYRRFVQESEAKGILVFAKGGKEPGQKLSARVFVPYLGIPEDPATGSANGCLAAYLLKYNFFGAPQFAVKVGQGYEMNRPSELLLEASMHENQYNIKIGGKVIDIAEGFWNI